MSDKTNIDASASAFGNSMSLDGGVQGGERSPGTQRALTTTSDFRNELDKLPSVPQGVAASAEQLAAAEAAPQQARPQTARQLASYINNTTTNKRGPPTSSSDGSGSDDSEFDDPAHLVDAKEIIEVCSEQGPSLYVMKSNPTSYSLETN
jgi:hypothetical protein